MTSFLRKYKSSYIALLRLGIPIMIGQFGVVVVAFADNIMVGHHSTPELAAASFVNNLFMLPIMFALGFSYGLTPIIGNLVGRKQEKEAGQYLRCGLLSNFLLSLVLIGVMSVVYFNLHRMGQPEELLPLIRPYYIIQIISLLFVMLFNAFKQFSDGMTDTQTPMYILIASNVINIIGNYILIYGKYGFPELGLTGAGISTLISRIFCLLAFLVIFMGKSKYADFRKGFSELKGNKEGLGRIARLGTPLAFQMGMETASFNISVIMMGWLGSAALAAHQITGTFTTLGFMMYYGIGASITILVSRYKALEDVARVKNVAYAGVHIIMAMAFVVSVIMLFTRFKIGYVFTDSDEVAYIVALIMIPTILYQFGDGLQVAMANVLRGIEDVKPMVYIAFVSYFLVCLPVGYFFGFVLDWGAVGIWSGFPIGLTLAGVLFFIRFRYKLKKGL